MLLRWLARPYSKLKENMGEKHLRDGWALLAGHHLNGWLAGPSTQLKIKLAEHHLNIWLVGLSVQPNVAGIIPRIP